MVGTKKFKTMLEVVEHYKKFPLLKNTKLTVPASDKDAEDHGNEVWYRLKASVGKEVHSKRVSNFLSTS